MKTTNYRGQVFEPLLRQFCETTKSVGIDKNFSTVFLPHIMRNYSHSDRKIFYFGRDTNGWVPTSQLMKVYSENNLMKYFEETSNWVNEFGFLEYNKNKSSSFWTLAMRLHLRLKGYTENLKIGDDLPDEYYDYINDFGWGNTNAIEVPASLKTQGIWDTIDKNKYKTVKEESKIFDKLIHTIKAYNPDLVFIFNWVCDEKAFLEGLNYQEQKINLISNHFWTYYLPDTNTRIIWTVHPTGARWLSYKTDSMIDEIIDYLQKVEQT